MPIFKASLSIKIHKSLYYKFKVKKTIIKLVHESFKGKLVFKYIWGRTNFLCAFSISEAKKSRPGLRKGVVLVLYRNLNIGKGVLAFSKSQYSCSFRQNENPQTFLP